MLERARATALALLGATAAVGLAIAAIAANQGWPLVAGSSIPPVPHQGVGQATVVARAASPSPRHQGTGRRGTGGGAAHADRGGSAQSTPVHTAPGDEEAHALVVSNEVPVSSGGGPSPKEAPAQSKHPASPSQPGPAPQAPAVSTPPPPTPAPPPSPAPSPPAPEASSLAVPAEESDVPAWSQGKGHAYGRSESWDDEEDDSYEDEDEDDHDHGCDHGGDHGDSHGHWGD
jgi:hypothetical protein